MILAADIRPGCAQLAFFGPDLEPRQVATFPVSDLRQLISVVGRFPARAPFVADTACFAVDASFDVYAHELAAIREIRVVSVVDTAEAGARLQLEGLERDGAAVLVGAAQIASRHLPPSDGRVVLAREPHARRRDRLLRGNRRSRPPEAPA